MCLVPIMLLLIFVITIIILYDVIFSTNKRYMGDDDTLPMGEKYNAYHEIITACVREVRSLAYEDVYISSYDGLRLHGKYYHQTDGAPTMLFFHGYRSSTIRDGNGIFLYCHALGFNVLMADQRAHGKSEGKTITFGIRERFDVKSWAEYMVERFGKKQKIYISGLSMGGATVLMAENVGLPEQVIGVLADCPYSSPKEILTTVLKTLGFPVRMTYFFAKRSAAWIGRFDMEETSAVQAVQESKIPTLILHGDADDFVPCTMSMDCRFAASEHVRLVLIKGAAHGMSHCADMETYETAMYEFFLETGGLSNTHINNSLT